MVMKMIQNVFMRVYEDKLVMKMIQNVLMNGCACICQVDNTKVSEKD